MRVILLLFVQILITHASLPNPSVRNACGIYTSDRIVGGIETGIDEFPWMALLEYTFKDTGKKVFGCGGSLIDERHILTAAHCLFENPVLTSVRLGEWNTSTELDCFPPVPPFTVSDDCADPPIDVAVSKIFKHPSYNKDGQEYNDIAVIRLEKSVNYSYFIKPICLPSDENLRNKTNFAGMKFIVSGWGRTETSVSSDTKLKTSVDGVNLVECNAAYQQLGRVITDKQLCAGGKKSRDSCQGDSGGPLMTLYQENKQNYAYLAGVVSFGPQKCGLKGWPGIYTRVGAYVDWIKECVETP